MQTRAGWSCPLICEGRSFRRSLPSRRAFLYLDSDPYWSGGKPKFLSRLEILRWMHILEAPCMDKGPVLRSCL